MMVLCRMLLCTSPLLDLTLNFFGIVRFCSTNGTDLCHRVCVCVCMGVGVGVGVGAV